MSKVNLKPIRRGDTWSIDFKFWSDSCKTTPIDVSTYVFKLMAKNAAGATQWTWDTIDHRRGNAGGFFNQYYGEHTRQYQARYDRVYVHENDMIDLAIPPTFELIANQPLTSYKDFLSDHFGVTSHFQLTWNVR